MNRKVFISRVLIFLLLFFIIDFLVSAFLLNGIEKYYGVNKSPDVLINGSSMSISGFDRNAISEKTGLKVANYSNEGVSVIDRHVMISHFFEINPDKVKTLIYEVNPVLFSKEATAANVYTTFYPFMDSDSVKSYIKLNADIKDFVIRKIIRCSRYDARLMKQAIQGYMGRYTNVKVNKVDNAAVEKLLLQRGKERVSMDEDLIEIFEATTYIAREHGVEVLLVMMPMYHPKLETFDMNEYQQLCDYFENYSKNNEGIAFLNMNTDELINEPGFFSDPLHFNVYGQEKVTEYISSILLMEHSSESVVELVSPNIEISN